MADITKLNFISQNPIDKVVGMFKEQTTTHTVGAATPLGGGFYAPKTDILAVANPVGQQAWPTVAFSTDGTNFYNGRARLSTPGKTPYTRPSATVGMAAGSVNVYFYFTHYNPSSTNFTIKWLLDYLDTGSQAPVEVPVAPGTPGLLLTTSKNYMKLHPSSGSGVMNGPNISESFGSFYTRTFTVNHGLGYPPFYRVAYEPFVDGKLFPAINDQQNYLSDPINNYGGSADGPTLHATVDNNNLYLVMFFTSNALASTQFPIHWKIYEDYGLAQ